MARVKLADVARKAGVSVSAASLVLNDKPSRISEATARAIREAAQELGYSPDLNARSLRQHHTRTIGLISDVIVTTPYAAGLIQGVQEAAWQRDHMLLIGNTESDPEREHDVVQAMSARRVDGYLYGGMYHRVMSVPPVLDNELVVGLDVELDRGLSFVPDERGGAAAATRHLLEHGHRRLAHIQGRPGVIAARQRGETFIELVAEAGAEAVVDAMPEDFDGPDTAFGELAAHRLLRHPAPPTAIFAYNDAMAAGVVRAATALGLEVPHDISLVGFDDMPFITQELLPTLSTVALPHREMGRLAASALIDWVEGGPHREGVHLVECPLRARGTVTSPAG